MDHIAFERGDWAAARAAAREAVELDGDTNGSWFQAYAQYPPGGASNSGMVLYVPNSGLYWMSNISGQIAGGCN